jgi:hypothetical protein
MKLNLTLSQRPEKTWVHYDVEIESLDGKKRKYNYSKHYGCYNPPHPSHEIEKKFDGKINFNKLCKRLFINSMNDSQKFYFDCKDYDKGDQVEINKIELFEDFDDEYYKVWLEIHGRPYPFTKDGNNVEESND